MTAATTQRGAWLAVALLWLVAFLNYLDRLILITMRTSIKASIPMTDAQFGLLTTVFLVAYALLGPVGGFIADRWNRSRIIIFSLLAWSLTTWLTAHATSFGELLLCRALMGVSEACYFPAAGALLMRYHGNATRSLANGIHLSGVMVGSGLGGLGGWLADLYDWTLVFSLFGGLGVAYAVVLLFLLRDPAPATGSEEVDGPNAPRLGETLRHLASRPALLIALLFWGLLGIASWAFSGWLPTHVQEKFSLTQGQAGLTTLGTIYAASLVGMVVGGLWADRWSQSHPRGRIWVGVIGVLLAIPGVLLVANAAALPMVICGMVLYGLGRPFPDASMVPLLCQIIHLRYLATAVGILNSFAVLVGGLTIYLGGVLRDAQVPVTTVFNFGAAGLLVCAFLLWRVRPHPVASRP